MEARIEIERLLHQYGFVLERRKNHQVWKNPAGLQFVLSHTPSDYRSYDNALGDLRRTIGIIPQHTPGERRPKKTNGPQSPPRFTLTPTNLHPRPSWRDQLATLKPLLMQRLPTHPPAKNGSKAQRIEFETSEGMVRWLAYGILMDAQKHLRNHKSNHTGDRLAIQVLTKAMEQVVCPEMKF